MARVNELLTARFWVSMVAMGAGLVLVLTDANRELGSLLMMSVLVAYGLMVGREHKSSAPALAGAALLLGLSACAPGAAYVEADRLTHEAIAPEYRGYVDADQALDAEAKARRHRTVDAWAVRIERAGGGK